MGRQAREACWRPAAPAPRQASPCWGRWLLSTSGRGPGLRGLRCPCSPRVKSCPRGRAASPTMGTPPLLPSANSPGGSLPATPRVGSSSGSPLPGPGGTWPAALLRTVMRGLGPSKQRDEAARSPVNDPGASGRRQDSGCSVIPASACPTILVSQMSPGPGQVGGFPPPLATSRVWVASWVERTSLPSMDATRIRCPLPRGARTWGQEGPGG